MINPAIIITSSGLYTRVGWRQPTQTGYNILTGDNLTTGSGLYFQDFHPMVTIENIKSHQPDNAISDANFNILLNNYQKSAILKIINAVISDKKDLINDKPLFAYPNIKTNSIDNNSKFVGYEINLADCNDIAIRIKSILLEFDSEKTFTIYLFQADRKSSIQSQEITTLENDVKIVELNWDLYAKSSTYSSSRFYIGYFQNDLGNTKALNREWDLANVKTAYNYFNVESMNVEPNGISLFDIEDIEYDSNTWGLNFEIATHHDYTYHISQNKMLFDRAIGLQITIDMLNMMYSSARSNRIQKLSKEEITQIYFDLNGFEGNENIPKSVGLYGRLRNEINKIKKSGFVDKKRIRTVTA